MRWKTETKITNILVCTFHLWRKDQETTLQCNKCSGGANTVEPWTTQGWGLPAPLPCTVKNPSITLDSPKTYLLIGYYWPEPDRLSSQLTHILYAVCIICCILIIKKTREKKILRKSKRRENTFTGFTEKNLLMSGPAQLKLGCPGSTGQRAVGTRRMGLWPHPDGGQVWRGLSLSRKVLQWVTCKPTPGRDAHTINVIRGVNHEWIKCEFEAEWTARVQTWRLKIARLYLGTGKCHKYPDSGDSRRVGRGKQEVWQGLCSGLDFILMAREATDSEEAPRWDLTVLEHPRNLGNRELLHFPLWPLFQKGQ